MHANNLHAELTWDVASVPLEKRPKFLGQAQGSVPPPQRLDSGWGVWGRMGSEEGRASGLFVLQGLSLRDK